MISKNKNYYKTLLMWYLAIRRKRESCRKKRKTRENSNFYCFNFFAFMILRRIDRNWASSTGTFIMLLPVPPYIHTYDYFFGIKGANGPKTRKTSLIRHCKLKGAELVVLHILSVCLIEDLLPSVLHFTHPIGGGTHLNLMRLGGICSMWFR